jgi:hypothetical protein
MVHVVYETVPHLTMKFSLYVLVSFSDSLGNFNKDEKSSLTHWNLHTEMSIMPKKTLQSDGEKFHTPPAISSHIFLYGSILFSDFWMMENRLTKLGKL